MKTLVTGTPDSGKTTPTNYARQAKYLGFVDADKILGLCGWREFITGNVPGLVMDVKTIDWRLMSQPRWRYTKAVPIRTRTNGEGSKDGHYIDTRDEVQL